MRDRDVSAAKWTYVTRTVPTGSPVSTAPLASSVRSGDLVVARVERIGAHDHIEDRNGRRVRMFPGDLIVGACGNRYATDFFEGYVPEGSRTQLLTAGGLIGDVASAYDAHQDPTELQLVGSLVVDDRGPARVADFARLPSPSVPEGTDVDVIVVVGSGMNAGKTTTVAGIIRGLTRAGFAVGAGKVTGSGSGKDRWAYEDAGAAALADFLDFGMPSTFGYPLERLGATLLEIRDALVADGAEVVVLEIADGLLQSETAWLVERLPDVADAVVFAAVDALSARSGVEILREIGLPLKAVSGLLTRSPLATREAARVTGLPILSPAELAGGAAVDLLARETVLA
jgi:hypothetical protein